MALRSPTRLLTLGKQKLRRTPALGMVYQTAQLTTLGKAFNEKEARKWLQFTCTHEECKQTSDSDRIVRKTISTLAYEKGVVLVRCNCDKLHLIADRLGWFQDGGTDIEKIAQENGIKLEKGVLEYNPGADSKKQAAGHEASDTAKPSKPNNEV